MRYLLIALPVVCAAVLAGCGPKPIPTAAPPDVPEVVTLDVPVDDAKELAAGNNAFALDLFRKMADARPGNVVLSPYSVRTALAMTYAGARGETKEEMKKVLRFTLPDDRLQAALGAVTDSMQTAGKGRAYELNIANALWPQKGMALLPGFLDVTGRHYAAGVRELDFANPEAARKAINDAVKAQTKDHIAELFPPGVLDTDTRMVLTNAVFFQGRWKTAFDKKDTGDREFELSRGKKVMVPMLSAHDMPCRLGGNEDFRLLELSYREDRWRMLVLLPTTRHGLAEVEGSLTAEQLAEAIAALRDSKIDVTLPKFKHRLPAHLNGVLAELGMPRAFSERRADFGGITADRKLFIGHVVHEAMIEMDEAGTAAAAATGVVMKTVSAPPTFRADQPFLYFLHDSATGHILFAGRVADPR